MQNSNIRECSLHVIAAADQTHVDNCRNWIREQFLGGIGERISGMWHFNYAEALMILLAAQLGRAGLGYAEAFRAVIKNPAPDVIAALAGADDITLRFSPRRDVGAMSCTVMIVVDASAIVKEASKRLDFALEAERHRPHRRLAFEPAPPASSAARN